MIRAINALGQNPATDAAVDLLVCRGDLDRQLSGQRVSLGHLAARRLRSLVPIPGGALYEGVSSEAWGDAAYWHPDPCPDD